MKIDILTPQSTLKRGFNDFYPILKWIKQFRKAGIKINFISNSKFPNSKTDILIVDSRYLQTLYSDRNVKEDERISRTIAALCQHGKKTVLYDNGDGAGSRAFWLTPLFDLHVKKQVLRNKQDYIIDNEDKSLMPWIPDDATPSNIPYKPLAISQISKIKLGWNIGMLDYRFFPLKNYYPIGTSGLFNQFYTSLKFLPPDHKKKEILTQYRGGISLDTRYSYQRKLTIEVLNKLKTENIPVITGGRVSHSQFINEFKKSHLAVSPFGWGEICYRDFEAIIYGNILVKPDMSHIDTFPNIYLPMETYVPVKWNMEDLPNIISEIRGNLSKYKKIALNAQKLYKELYNNDQKFIEQFKQAIEI